jgi:hypothetical protein
MKPTAKILKFKDKKLETIEAVRAALIAIFGDLESGDATSAEAKPIQAEIINPMRKVHAQIKTRKPQRTMLRSSHFLESKRCHAIRTGVELR